MTKTPSDLYCATTGAIIVSRGRRGSKDIDSLFSFLRRSVLDPVGAISFYETNDDRKLNFEHARIMPRSLPAARCQERSEGLEGLKERNCDTFTQHVASLGVTVGTGSMV